MTNGDNQFIEPERSDPTEDEVSKLIRLLISSSVNICMSDHCYMIGGLIRKQEGSSIGTDALDVLSRVFRLLWE